MEKDGSAAPARKSGKFQPKSSARRSQNEREKEEQAEATRKRQRQIEADRAVPRQRPSHGGLTRTRGGGQHRGGLSGWRNESQATGFLGAAISVAPTAVNVESDGLSDSEPVSRPPARTRRKSDELVISDKKHKAKAATQDDPVNQQLKEEEGRTVNVPKTEPFPARRGINIDDLAHNNLVSDEELEDKSDHAPRKALYPIRLKRKAVTDQKATGGTKEDSKAPEQTHQKVISEAASALKQRTTMTDDDDLKVTKTVNVGKRRPRTRQSRRSEIKEEEDSKPDVSIQNSARDRHSAARDYINVSDDDQPESLRAQPSRLGTKQTLFSKPIQQTVEDHEEWQRHQADRKAIAEELGPDNDYTPEQSSIVAGKQKGADGRRDDKVYLLQLPPIMPNLQARFDTEHHESDTSMHDLGPDGNAQQPAATQGDTREAPVKVEDDVGATETESAARLEHCLSAINKSKFKGPIGTLTVYQRGDAILDWGGIEFQLERGVSGMLQEALLVDDESSAAYSMSQIAATFVVKPNWDALFEAKV